MTTATEFFSFTFDVDTPGVAVVDAAAFDRVTAFWNTTKGERVRDPWGTQESARVDLLSPLGALMFVVRSFQRDGRMVVREGDTMNTLPMVIAEGDSLFLAA